MTPLLLTGLIWLLQSTGLLGLGLLALWLARRSGPAAQTLVGRATLVAVALALLTLPLASHVQPLWRVSLPTEDRSLTLNSGRQTSTIAPPTAIPPLPGLPPDAALPSADTSPPPGVPNAPPVTVSLLSRLYTILVTFWGIGTTALLLWLGVCHWHLICLRRAAHSLTSGPAADALTGLTLHPTWLLSHPAVRSPFLAGILRPAIFLPDEAETDFSPDALRAILAHELEHLARRDCAWTLFGRILCAALWPQPLLWVLCRRLEAIGEEACDLSVLARDFPPRAYADCLLSLAERWQPSHRERTVGAGVAPLRSSLGRRIKQILATRRPLLGLTRSLRFGVASCVLLALSGSFMLLNARTEVPHFVWAKQQGWTVQPIRIIDLDHPKLTQMTSLPYDITERDKATMKQLSDESSTYWGLPGPPIAEKTRLESILKIQPHFFYAEYLLGSWYRLHGDTARATALLEQSLRDALVILAGRYEYDDGTPVAGLRFETSIQCYSPTHVTAKNAEARKLAVELKYSDVVTDADGCYYLPIFRAIYSQSGIAWRPDELNRLTASHLKAHADLVTPGPSTSGITYGGEIRLNTGFIAASRVAMLPQTEVRPVLALSAPFNGAEGSTAKPLQINSSNLTISWQPYPKAVSYKVTIYEIHNYPNAETRTGLNVSPQNPSRLSIPITQTSARLDFAGTDPIFNRTCSYTVTIEALDRNGELVSQSDQFYFQPRNALAPQPLTKAALAQALGSGFTLISLQSQKDKVVVKVSVSTNLQYSQAGYDAVADSGRRFGLGFDGWSDNPLLSKAEPNVARTIQFTYNHSVD